MCLQADTGAQCNVRALQESYKYMCLQADTGAQCNVVPLCYKKATNICVSKQILELSVMCCL